MSAQQADSQPPQFMDHCARPVLMHVCRDGTITYRLRNQPIFNKVALPFFSVDSEDEARRLQVTLCAKQYTEHPKQPGRPWFVVPRFPGTIEAIDDLTQKFASIYSLMKQRQRKEAE